MLLRNRIARGVAAGALVLALPSLAACSGFATDKVYTPAPGANDRSGDVDVLNAVIVATQDGHGTLLATFANNLDSNEKNDFADVTDKLTAVSGDFTADLPAGDAADNKAVDAVASPGPVVIPPSSAFVLSATGDASGIPVDGDFKLGDFVTVTLTFANAGDVVVDVPVVCNANHWEGQDTNPANADAELAPQCEGIGEGDSAEAGH